jgi:hypothetical protein
MAHETEEVLNIRLPNFETEDFVSWHFEKNGTFSVRSAYKLELDGKMTMLTNSSHSSNGDRKLWNTIWKPPKVRVFTRKLATN